MKNHVRASTYKPIYNRVLGTCIAAMIMSTSMLMAQLKVTFNQDGDNTTPSGTITVHLSDNTATLSNLTGTMGINPPSVSGGFGGLSGSFDITFEALGTVAQNFDPNDFTGGVADGVFTTASEWAANSDLEGDGNTANNAPGQGIVFTFDFTNLVGGTNIELTAVRWRSNSNSSRLSFLGGGVGTSSLIAPSENTTFSEISDRDQIETFTVPQALNTTDQLGFWSDGSGQKRLKEFTFNFVPDGITPPVNLVGTTDGAKVDLDWADDQSGELASYSVFRGEAPGGPYGEAIATGVLSSEYSDPNVVTGTTYHYVVTATDTEGTETDFSNEFEITPVIQAPTNLTATAGDGVVDLDWNDDTSGILGSYSVYRSEVEGGPYDTPLVTGLTGSEYSDTSVSNETTYYYVITATDNLTADESANSAEDSATPFTPVPGSALFVHLDASVESSVVLDASGPEVDKVLVWEDLIDNSFDSTAGEDIGTVRYPSDTRSPTDLPGLDMGADRNTLLAFNAAGSDQWLDFTSGANALPYTGFSVFAVVTVDSILAGTNRDIVISSIESNFRLGYEAGRPQFILGDGTNLVTIENSETGVVEAGDTLILAVNYDATTGKLELWDSVTGTTGSATVPASNFTNGNMLLGGSRNEDQFMDGMIGEVKVYRGAMTPTEFQDEREALRFKWVGLTPPSGLVATPGDTQVALDWDDQSVDAFQVFRNGEFLVEVIESNYTDMDLTNGQEYVYSVVALDGEAVSVQTEAVSATPFNPQATIFYHLDASDANNVAVSGGVLQSWANLGDPDLFDAFPQDGTLLYPSTSLSPTDLPGVDTGSDRNTLLTLIEAEQDLWLDFTTAENGAQAFSGFAVFAVVKADSILGGVNRDVVLSSDGSSFSLGYEGGRPQVILNSETLENSETGVIEAEDTVVIAVNYEVASGTLSLWDSKTGTTSSTTIAAGDFSSSENMLLGGSVNTDEFMDGMIGEVKIYRGVMTASEFATEQTTLVTKWIGAPPAAAFSDWQSANSTTEGLDGDHDLDGVANGIEFFLGGMSDTTGFTPAPGVVDNGDALSVTWVKDPSYPGTYGTDFVVETSTTLVGEWDAVSEGVDVTIDGNNVTYAFPSTSAADKLFVRLRVTGP